MAAKRGKSQARRNSGNGVPGWAWLVAGVLIGVVVLLAAPRFLKSDAADGFFRPKPNPDAQPAPATASEEDEALVPESTAGTPAPGGPAAAAGKETTFDFYTVLPGEEVALSDAELAATQREEAAREAASAAAAAAAAAREATTVATTTPSGEPATAPARGAPAGDPATPAPASAAPPAPATGAGADAPPATDDASYVLQAGAFAASGDAEEVKARIALLGLGARVESAQIGGKTVYRVRMGPYGTASELAEAKRKLAGGGLPAMAVRVK